MEIGQNAIKICKVVPKDAPEKVVYLTGYIGDGRDREEAYLSFMRTLIEQKVDLTGISFKNESLVDLDFSGVNLIKCDFTEAYVKNCNFSGADLRHCKFRNTRLTGTTSFKNSNLTYSEWAMTTHLVSDFSSLRFDIPLGDWLGVKKAVTHILNACSLSEIEEIKQALKNGNIDGNHYYGDCCCLLGTIAKIRGEDPKKLKHIRSNIKGAAEQFFLSISQDDVPETSGFSRLAYGWVSDHQIKERQKKLFA